MKLKYRNNMRNIFRILFVLLFWLTIARMSFGVEYKFGNFKSTESIKSTAAGCGAPSGFKFLQVNNVRGRINTGGDMWWDLPGGIGSQYFVPANGSATSLFSGSLWIGGLDINNQLKLAALRYRQVGQDYWTGPLTIDGTAAIDAETCTEWDKFFDIKRADIDAYIEHTDPETGAFIPSPDYQIPEYFFSYPAHGDISKGQSFYLAPFKDANGDGAYDPTQGDYPYYDITNELCPLNYAGDPTYVPAPTMESELYENYFGGILVDQVLKGDETFWWVFNDKGNIHTETNGAAIGMEIRAQAFAFSTNDEINNMTFYSYEIINRSTYELTQTYFSPWADTDLGYAWDDFIGCDVERGLGYCYNGLPTDEGGPESYGDQPPAVGVDFFQGPYMDPDTCDNPSYKGDGLLGPSFDGSCEIVTSNGIVRTMQYGENNEFTGDFKVRAEAINGINFGNGIKDDERYGMRRFVYHNNGGAAYMNDPASAPQYYNLLRGIWNDNSRMLYGGNAHTSSGAAGPECDFMFPGDSDPCNWGTDGQPPEEGFNTNGLYWTEEEVGNQPSDRRFMQSAGPFTLKPGAVNYITVGIPWARAISGGPWASVQLLRVVDDKCQALFENCFKVIDGPDAPDLSFREIERGVIIYITNSPSSNNYRESYKELDPQIRAVSFDYDPYFTFEGYQIFQLKDANVTLAESRYDPNNVRLVAQFDVKNGIGKIVNFKYDNAIGANVPVIEVQGGDNGIVHSFTINTDAFATGDNTMINNKQYYFSAIAYGYNNYKEYDPTDPTALDGQKKPYLAGRKNILLYSVIPHKIVNGIIPTANFGDGPEITRIEGRGNGGMVLELTEQTIAEILSKPPAYLVVDELITDSITGEVIDTLFKYNYGQDDYPIAYKATYKSGAGPVSVKVIDPLNVKRASYTLKCDTAFIHYTFYNVTGAPEILPGGDTAGVKAFENWYLIDNETGQIYKSEVGTNINYEQVFPELGISITFGPVFYPGLYTVGQKEVVNSSGQTSLQNVKFVIADNNGLLTSSIEYSDSSKQWLRGVEDFDGNWPFNWIRSGTSFNQTFWDDYLDQANTYDPTEAYEKIFFGTWAPYYLCSKGNDQTTEQIGPVCYESISKTESKGLRGIASVDIVFTSEKSKWTRCPVIEMCQDSLLSQGRAKRFNLRKSASVDKNGNPSGWPLNKTISTNPEDPNYILSYGMGWFPGYAINLETGERMNIMFGEDSWLSGENGRDMLFNPTSNLISQPAGEILFGGKHYVYVMSSAEVVKTTPSATIKYSFPAYDAGRVLATSLDTIPELLAYRKIYMGLIYSTVMYVGMPMSNPDVPWLSNEATVKIRVGKPYERYYNAPLDVEGSINNHYPAYEFSTDGIATNFYNEEKALEDVDLIAVVPNPYYAFAVGPGYEEVPLDNKVKITNLPEKCAVSIYNISGTLIRKFTKDDPVTFIDWDLKNQAGIPIAGGIYLVHVKDQTTGKEVIVKWFGSLRVEDFKQF
jgi:hypothetical protein